MLKGPVYFGTWQSLHISEQPGMMTRTTDDKNFKCTTVYYTVCAQYKTHSYQWMSSLFSLNLHKSPFPNKNLIFWIPANNKKEFSFSIQKLDNKNKTTNRQA